MSAARFVVQLHDATTLHFDLRLEIAGVLRSWAVPKGPSLDPAVRRLAVPVEDHSLEAGEFEGVHEGHVRGSGAVVIWDEGTVEIAREEPDHLSFTLHGRKLNGGFGLTRTGERRWILVKARDADARPGSDIVAEQPASVRSGKTWRQLGYPDPQGASMDLALAGKVAVVTGASKGIGLAATRALVDEGASVVAGARSVASLEAIDGVTSVAVDLTAPDGPSQLIGRAIEVHGRVDVLVNNVGAVRIRTGGFLGTSDEEFAWSMNLNFFAGLRTTRAAIVHMLEQGGGAIVNVASINSFYQPDAGTIDYGAAKAAVVNVSKSIAQEFGPRGIRINCISPGPVGTELWLGEHGVAETIAAASGTDADTARAGVLAAIATGRFTTPEEVAALIAMLASDRLGNVTGSNFVIDGGMVKNI